VWNRSFVQLSPDQKRLYVSSQGVKPGTLDALPLPGKIDDKPAAYRAVAPAQYVLGGEFQATPDGRFLLGDKLTKQVSGFDPRTMRWRHLESEGKNDFNAEEGWTLLPDGTVLTLDVLDAPKAEVYSASEQEWRSSGWSASAWSPTW